MATSGSRGDSRKCLTTHKNRVIERVIFLTPGLCDLNPEAVNWNRSWIAEMGNQTLVSPHPK